MKPGDGRSPDAGRLAGTGAFVVIGVALVGLVAGTRPPTYKPIVPRRAQAEETAPHPIAQPARSYSELMARPWEPTQSHGAFLTATLAQPDRRVVDATHAEPREHAKAQRAARRAFAGAPPTIPHPVAQGNGVECRQCHERGGVLGATLVPPMSHEGYAQCTQCHVAERSGVPPAPGAFELQSRFDPLHDPPAPARWSAAPPQTPHRTFMRDRCDSCHGRYGRHGLQTSHPERQSCEQCHASAAVVDQVPRTP